MGGCGGGDGSGGGGGGTVPSESSCAVGPWPAAASARLLGRCRRRGTLSRLPGGRPAGRDGRGGRAGSRPSVTRDLRRSWVVSATAVSLLSAVLFLTQSLRTLSHLNLKLRMLTGWRKGRLRFDSESIIGFRVHVSEKVDPQEHVIKKKFRNNNAVMIIPGASTPDVSDRLLVYAVLPRHRSR